jgi:hypothetical protein
MISGHGSKGKKSMKLFNRLAYLFVVSILLIAMIATVKATTESLNVKADEDFVRQISISAEDHIHITFTVLSHSPGSLHFWIVFPNGTIGDYGKSTNYDINFVSDVQGECEMHFDNIDSLDTQLVTLNYEIEHYYFGIPEIPFLMLVIVILLLCIVTGYIIMGKYG